MSTNLVTNIFVLNVLPNPWQRIRTLQHDAQFGLEPAAYSRTDLDPHQVLGNHSGLVPALRMGDCRAIFETDPGTGKEILWLLAADSWASVSDGRVRQGGVRALWDEAVTAYQWWIDHDRPDRQQFHLTITPQRQWVWLDDPTNTVTTL